MKKKVKIGGRLHKLGILGKSFSIINHKAYQYFIKNSNMSSRENVANYVEHGKIISEYYRIVGEKIVESSGGVFVDGLGYFGVIQNASSNKVVKYPAFGYSTINPKTEGRIYNLAFVPIDKTNSLKAWVFDYTFCPTIRKNLKEALRSGKKYSFNASLFFNKKRKTGNDY